MSYSIDPVVADQALFEKFYGPQDGPAEYREWHHQTVEARIQLAEYERLWKLVPLEFKARLTTEPNVDAQILQDTTNDLGDAIRLIQAGKRVNKAQMVAIAEIQSSALEALTMINSTLNALFTVSFFSFMMNMQFRNIERAAQEAVPKIQALQRNLEQARKKATQAKFQLAIDAALTVAQVLLPEVTVITRVGIAVGQWALDKVLGDDKSTPTRDKVSDAGTQAAIVQAGMQDGKWLTPGQNKLVTKAGKPLSVVGLYFDQDEVRATMDRVDVAQSVLNAAIESLRKIKALLARHRPAMVQFKVQLSRVAQNLQDSWDTAAKLRWERMTLMSDADYRPLVRTKWKIDPAPQPAVTAR